jgi:hypothetical protein
MSRKDESKAKEGFVTISVNDYLLMRDQVSFFSFVASPELSLCCRVAPAYTKFASHLET